MPGLPPRSESHSQMNGSHAAKSIFGSNPRPTAQQSLSGSLQVRSNASVSDPLEIGSLLKSTQSARSSKQSTGVNPARSKRRKGHGERPQHIQLPEPPFQTSHIGEIKALSTVPSLGSKRSLSGSDIPTTKTSHKRPRLRGSGSGASYSFLNLANLPPQSPLFFSHTSHLRPELPPRFSSSEAGEKMLSKANGEDASIKTVTLARGSYLGGSPPTSQPLSRNRASLDRPDTARQASPEFYDKPEQSLLLSQISITELLDQDDRPIFVVDLSDKTNYSHGVFNILFANTSLTSCGSLLDSLYGQPDAERSTSLAPNSYSRFREWVLGTSHNNEVFHGASPPFLGGPLSWTASTLRNRFRVISGTLIEGSVRRTSSSTGFPTAAASDSGPSELSISRRASSTFNIHEHSTTSRQHEPSDYFGVAEAEEGSLAPVNSGTSRRDFEPVTKTINISVDQFTAPARQVLTPPTLSPVPIETFGLELVKTPQNDEIFDWTRIPDVDSLPPHIRFARSVDWSSTALGPIKDWSADLRQMVNLIMASPHPAAMYWGPDLVAIYNEAYVFLAGQKHPALMGQSYSAAWAEIWDEVKDVFASAQSTGQATMKDDDCLFIKRSNVLEETYFSWSIIPMVGGDGTVKGLYNPAFEKTRRKVAERRMLTLREVGERTAAARDVKGFWAAVLAALECNELDTPFVLLYSLAEDDSSEDASATESTTSGGPRQCFLEGALGVPEGHAAAPSSMDLRTGSEGYAPIFRDAMQNNQTLVLDVAKGEVPPELLEGLETRGFGDASRSAVVCPIHPTTGENVLGFLVMGVNPRRPYDDDYSLFIQLLSRQLATSLASVVLFEEEIRRGQRAAKMAALDKIELSEQLAARTQEAIESETKFTRMAEFAPVGMFIANSEGEIIYCNDTWYDITRIPKELNPAQNWVDFVVPDDKLLIRQLWQDLVENTKPISTEFRFKAPWIDRSGASSETWVLFSAYPEPHDDGTLKSVFGSITNISSQKWAEGLQKKKMEEAVELKRQQENFIDITSHEMRNPLSAILQCADEIVTSLTDAKTNRAGDFDTALYDGNIDAAQTIALCAQHQKRIVDDVLTMSKIDSALLMVTPVDSQPLTIVQRALKMFEGELSSADILMDFHVDFSFNELKVNWVRFDPSRVMQVLINLTTNAIKFTTTEQKRTISVTLAASTQPFSRSATTVVKYVPRRHSRADMTSGVDWGKGEELYLQFAVTDTGRGLSEQEKKSLFLRFSQASPRTHVQYGGSGLGLFISRELTELQGGEIGVASAAGVGSTFAFYVKARRTNAPEDPTEQLTPSLGLRRTSDGKGSIRTSTAPRVRDFAEKDGIREELKILLVEDNLVNQRVLQKQLKKLGCEVSVANHGREALERIQESRFWADAADDPKASDIRIVLMDQEMPIMDGITCTKAVRGLEKEGKIVRHVPILGITANAREEQIQQLLEAGMDDVVSKPFRIAEIVPKVEELAARFRPHRM